MKRLVEIRKAVITAAGWGTRFLPLTKAQPKEMLPLVDKPVIQYAVDEAIAAGLVEITLVTSPNKESIEAFFSRSPKLEAFLAQKEEWGILDKVCHILDSAEVCYVRQEVPLGLGHAVLTARQSVGNEPFALLLPDEILEDELLGPMMRLHEQYGASIVAVEKMVGRDIEKYGVIRPEEIAPGVYRVLDLVEKPSLREAPSDLAIVGRYILTPEIFPALEATSPGKNDEIQLTDAMKLLLKKQPLYALEYKGVRHDVGVPFGWLKSLTVLSLRHPELGPPFKEFLKKLKLD